MTYGQNGRSGFTVNPPSPTALPEIYMRVIDHRRLQKLMLIQGVTTRQLATAIGYKSHAHLGLVVRGQYPTVTPEKAARIARYLGVGVDDLFVPRLSTDAAQSVRSRRAS